MYLGYSHYFGIRSTVGRWAVLDKTDGKGLPWPLTLLIRNKMYQSDKAKKVISEVTFTNQVAKG